MANCSTPLQANARLKEGAKSCLEKSKQLSDLCQAIRQGASGEIILYPEFVLQAPGFIQQAESGLGEEADVSELIPREIEIQALIARSGSNKAIAEHSYLNIRIVEGHFLSLYKKLNVNNRTEAALFDHQSSLTSECG
jgi:NarL family two-component system response regulator LiaR